jgi:hypothetical protein
MEFNSIDQIVFPWTFDAVHYPFLKIGWGMAAPSFLCFLGLVVMVFYLVSTRWGTNVGLWDQLNEGWCRHHQFTGVVAVAEFTGEEKCVELKAQNYVV